MPLRDYIQRYEDGGDVTRETEDVTGTDDSATTAAPVTAATASKKSPLAQKTEQLTGSPDAQAVRDSRLRAYYDKQLADIQQRENSFAESTGINEVLAQFGAPPGAEDIWARQRASELSSRNLGRKEAETGLSELDTQKALTAQRKTVTDLLSSGNPEDREKARIMDPDYYKRFAESVKTENQPPKGQLTDYQRIQAEEKLDESKANIANIKSNISSAIQYEKEIVSLVDHPGLQKATGSFAGRTFTWDKDAQDFEDLLESVKSKVFLANVTSMKGMGALSNAEGEKIAAAQAALKLTLSPDEMRRQLKIIQDTYKKGADKQRELLASAERRHEQQKRVLSGEAGVTQQGNKPAAKPAAASATPPAVGTVMEYNGVKYSFQGGDPSVKTNWKAV